MGKTFIVAEPGCTHEGKLQTMKRLIEAAYGAGCDAFKNQYISKPEKVRRRRDAVGLYPSYDWLSYSLEFHAICRDWCRRFGMQYGCSTNLVEDFDKVRPYVDFHKRPSFENNDHEWLAEAKLSGERFIVSTGMLDDEGLCRLIDEVHRFGKILHCTSSYKTNEEDVNLDVIDQYQLDGLSDHTKDVDTGSFAACMASTNTIEAHICLPDTPADNPDRSAALEPDDYREYVRRIRKAERMRGDGVKRIQPSEEPMLRYKI